MRILFQGDSITDAGSYHKEYPELTGYTKYTAELLGAEHTYFNRGISGNRSIDVLARYDADIKDVQPDVMTLLIGINDLWRRFDSGLYTSAEQYAVNVREIATKFRNDFPNAKLVILEPYLVPNESKAYFRPALAEFIQACRAVAVELADGFIPLDGLFAKENMTVPAEELSADGVHPAQKGQEMIARYLAEEIQRVCAQSADM